MKNLYPKSKSILNKYKDFNIVDLPKHVQDDLLQAEANISQLHELWSVLLDSGYPFDPEEFMKYKENLNRFLTKERNEK